MGKYVQYLEVVSKYSWEHAGKDKDYLKREKLFMDECLHLIDLTVLPNVSAEYIAETRRMVLAGLEEPEEHKEALKERQESLRALLYSSGSKPSNEQIYYAWQALNALFLTTYGASGDPLIESFAESMVCDSGIDEDVVAALLLKHFKGIIA